MQTNNYLEVATSGIDAVVKVFGLGDMHLAPVLDELCAVLRCEKNVLHLAIDLQNCGGMDSTFMGTLTGITATYADFCGWVCITNISPANYKLLEMLGVAAFVQTKNNFALDDLATTRIDIPQLADHAHRLEVIKKAHEQLIAIDERNREKFGAFLAALGAEISAENNNV